MLLAPKHLTATTITVLVVVQCLPTSSVGTHYPYASFSIARLLENIIISLYTIVALRNISVFENVAMYCASSKQPTPYKAAWASVGVPLGEGPN